MKRPRGDVHIAAALAVLLLAAGLAWVASPGPPTADSRPVLPAQGPTTTARLAPSALPAQPAPQAPSLAPQQAAARPGAVAVRPDTALPSTPSGLGVLVSHGSGVWVQTAPASGLGRELGLAAGDRIVRINGRAVTQALDVAHGLGQLPAQGTLRIDGLRNGKPMSLYHSGSEVPSTQE